ncbi:DNA/RNA helicase domain-containing protein [uncultured Ruminobacter sp.]|uniref:DNA/RNA helicase domain-containing protein n=1 Tax=uncultured Ruminobacter sp. TaxID=538947 RepID=UPI0025E52E2E|nr:DNA/RNA helicase domain-containing protein [uncultured Ruminobacter sp.]
MNKYTFSTQTGKAYYCNSIPGFLNDKSASIIGQLVRHSFEVNKEQSDAWDNQISQLQAKLEECGVEGDIIFEYDIVRLGKRIDVILLIKHIVFSLEFKNGKNIFVAQDAQQAEDYAIDIKNFHKESEDLYVCPILIATNAPKYKKEQSIDCYPDKQIFLQRENMDTFTPKLTSIIERYGDNEIIDFEKWFNSPYHPTPTIIAAAVEAYTSHDISQIAQSEAGQDNIDKCEREIERIINYARDNHRKCVCFVTGVPGAGKTLVGLDVVAKNLNKGKDNLSVYLSGNGPLVEVLREALKRSVKEKMSKESKEVKRETETAINTLIQSSYSFKKDNAKNVLPTPEHIMIFDEAQRVWNEQKMTSKHEKDPVMSVSEPHLLFRIMDRHEQWAVMICLVGLGQDIYDGEVGINEWFCCGIDDYKDWEMFYSSAIFSQTEDKNIDKDKILSCERCHQVDSLHLKTSVRSFRADKQCQFVDYLLDNKPDNARKIYEQIKEKYPVYITRDVEVAKKWAKNQVRGSQRCGVLACSSAQRLKPEGIYVPKDIDVKNWFLAPSDDLRSSNMMEVVASEFKVQGLEIDWAVVCWDADLRRKNLNEWDHYYFHGTKWLHRNKEEQKRYLVNSYRVLLTRARQGMIIFVPKGGDPDEDPSRYYNFYNQIYEYLIDCGIEEMIKGE